MHRSAAILSGLVLLQAPIRAQDGAATSPESLERIRAALRQPAPVFQAAALPDGPLAFRVEVSAPLPLLKTVEDPPFDPTFGLPSVGELVGRGIGRIQSAAATSRRKRATRRARKDVDGALAAFCAAHPCPPAP